MTSSRLAMISASTTALLLDREVTCHLGQAGDQSLKPLLGRTRRRRGLKLPDLCISGDDGGIDRVGLLQKAHGLGEPANLARIDDAARLACLPQRRKRQALTAPARLHHDQRRAVAAAEAGEFGDAAAIVAETACRPGRVDMGIEPLFRNIYSTDNRVHGNLPCACDWSQATIRSYVTQAKIPGSPTVVAGGATGDFATPRIGWPPDPRPIASISQNSFWVDTRGKYLLPQVRGTCERHPGKAVSARRSNLTH